MHGTTMPGVDCMLVARNHGKWPTAFYVLPWIACSAYGNAHNVREEHPVDWDTLNATTRLRER